MPRAGAAHKREAQSKKIKKPLDKLQKVCYTKGTRGQENRPQGQQPPQKNLKKISKTS